MLESTARIKLLVRQIVALFAEVASARGDMTSLEESIAVAQELTNAQEAPHLVEGECNAYRCHLGFKEKRCGGLEKWHHRLCTALVDYMSLVD